MIYWFFFLVLRWQDIVGILTDTLVCKLGIVIKHDNIYSSNDTLVCDDDIQNQAHKLLEKHIKLSETMALFYPN